MEFYGKKPCGHGIDQHEEQHDISADLICEFKEPVSFCAHIWNNKRSKEKTDDET